MKAMILSALYTPNVLGGAEKMAQVLAEGLRDAGHEPVVVTTDAAPGLRTARVNEVPVHYVGLKNVYWPFGGRQPSRLLKPAWHAINSFNPWMASAVAQLLDRERPDVVNTHSLTGFSFAVWREVRRRGIPLVHTLHDYSLLCPRVSMQSRGANCESPCAACRACSAPAQRLSALVDGVVGVSRHTLERHLARSYFPHARQRVIYNGLPLPAAAVDRAPASPAGPLRLGFVGRLVPNKGIGELVERMRAWPAQVCTLRVAGRGEPAYEDALRAAAPANVQFLGFVDPAEVYRQVDVLVVPSLYHDPLPTTVIEAYQHELPVIASNRGGLPELVEHQATGLLFDPAEPTGLEDAIGAFVRDRGRIGALRPRIAQRAHFFRVERMREEYLEQLTEAAGRGALPSLGAGAPQRA